jgi:hypothetical protein
MTTVNSLSGGKTSSYMAANYPADYNLFALVRIEDRNCTPDDKKLVQMISDKIGMEFIATAESDLTLKAVLDLEQLIGKEIIWVTGQTFEQVIFKKKALPNMMWRFCTTEMKLRPIFDYCNDVLCEFVNMNLGIRYDERERGFDRKTGEKKEDKPFKTIVGEHPNGNNKWAEIIWRNTNYPLIVDKVNHWHVKKWSESSGIIFPPDSNCVGCFWKPPMQLRKNWENEPKKMQWFSNMEKQLIRTFKKEGTYEQFKQIAIQQDFIFGTGAGCTSGFCTN